MTNGSTEGSKAGTKDESGLAVADAPRDVEIVVVLSPAAMRVVLENAKAIAAEIVPHMVPGYHYGNPDGKWNENQLLEPGASMIRSGFRIDANPEAIARNVDDEGHIHYQVTVGGAPWGSPRPIAHGVGSASTHETKYAYRWVEERDVPDGTDLSGLKWREYSGKRKYRVPNPDLGDIDNTILKMATKRAELDMTQQLPGCSEIRRLINPTKYGDIKTGAQMEALAKKAAPLVGGK